MNKVKDNNLFSKIYEVVKTIPPGLTMSYGQVAAACESPRAARIVGWALHNNPDPQNIPCHRVVFSDGSLSKSFAFGGESAQKTLLESEGVKFINDKVADAFRITSAKTRQSGH